jgi:anti-sigma factor RsiW
MDHRYIDRHAIAERYLKHALKPEERAAFETHLVDCSECADRLLLAEMFHARNGAAYASASYENPAVVEQEALPLRARFAAMLQPWQILLLAVLAALLLIAIPTVGFLLFSRR